MTALSKDRDTETKYKERVIHCKVAAAKVIYAGALVCWNSTGYLVPYTDAAGLSIAGRAEAYADNSAGGDGDVEVDVATGVFEWNASATLQADGQAAVGGMVYAKDDNTVGKASETTNDVPVGILEEIDANGLYWVSTGRRWRDETLGALALLDTVSATEIDAAAVTAAKLANAVADLISGAPTFAVGAEAANKIITTVTLNDAQGNALAAAQVCHVWISDTAGAAPTGTAPNGAVAIAGSGVQLKEVTTKVLHLVKSHTDGTFTVEVTESTAKSFYLNVAIGVNVASQIITFA